VVAARAGALPEVCGEAAVYCDPASGADIARGVAAVLDDPELAAELRARGRRQAARWTWPQAAMKLREVIGRCG
jgi:glycosyltransferase involved in cell wall biosynthesis